MSYSIQIMDIKGRNRVASVNPICVLDYIMVSGEGDKIYKVPTGTSLRAISLDYFNPLEANYSPQIGVSGNVVSWSGSKAEIPILVYAE